MKRLELKIPPVAVLLLCGGGMWLLSSLVPELSFDFPLRKLLSAIAVVAGLGIGVAGIVAFRAARTTFDPRYPDRASSVVRTGVYRHTRNPMYVGLLLSLMGWATYLANPLSLIGLPAFVLYMNRFQIQPEERALKEGFGEEYRAYLNDVRRWI
ncbi:MAG: isoprenylcysteine carboxylmethyltransferase family protein [Woeseiaceae bacterium]